MNVINNYNQLTISPLQSVRLYLQSRPLLHYWNQKRHKSAISPNAVINLIDKELDSDYISIDCAGWYFANDQRWCTAIELHDQSLRYWNDIYFEYDYLTWHPTYLKPLPVLAYFSSYFKYCELEEFLTFCNLWTQHHPKVIIGLDPTKIKFNYFKFNLLDLIHHKLPTLKIQVLQKKNFSLLFTLSSL